MVHIDSMRLSLRYGLWSETNGSSGPKRNAARKQFAAA